MFYFDPESDEAPSQRCILYNHAMASIDAQIPLVSVVVPVYNAEDYLNACIQSVLSQTYKKIEIILVNDGSTDASGALCDALEAEHPSISSFHQTNQGLSVTRNNGLAYSRGAYVTFVDSDDVIAPTMVERLMDTCIQNGVACAACAHLYFTHESELGKAADSSDTVLMPGRELLRLTYVGLTPIIRTS